MTDPDVPAETPRIAPVFDLRSGADHSVDQEVDKALEDLRDEAFGARSAGEHDLLDRLDDGIPAPPRALLVVIVALGLTQLVLVLPWLVDADPFDLVAASSPAHLARDGALGLAVAAAALLAAWRPRWALPCFALASVAIIAQAAAGIVDDSIASTGGSELIHLPSILLTCLIGLSTLHLRPLGPRRPPPPRRVR